MSQLDPGVLDQLAGDYVLGTLSGEERAYVAKLLRSSVDLQQRLRAWENRLNPLATALPPVTPPPRVWRAIERRIAPPAAGLRRRTLLAAAAAGLSLSLVVLAPFALRTSPDYVAILTAGGDARPALQASGSRHGNKLRVQRLQTPTVAANRLLILWALPADAPPRRLGILNAEADSELQLAQPLRTLLDGVATLAVSAEPVYAAATSLPHGEYLLKGPCVRLDD